VISCRRDNPKGVNKMAPKLSPLGEEGRRGFKRMGIKTDNRTKGYKFIRRVGVGAPKKK
jgi:hypothetical protein